jgi:hypothetical protein
MIVAKEELVGGEKYMRAYKLGRGEAIMMWWALKCYASKNPSTEGFIPDEDIDGLVGAPRQPRKALQALVECGGLRRDGSRGAGLVDPVEGGWQLHDYGDHSVPLEELELRRERAKLKKRQQRARQRIEIEELKEIGAAIEGLGQAGDMSPGQEGDSKGQVPRDTPRDVLGTVPPVARGPAPARTRAGAHPNPLQPSPPHPNLKSPSLTNEIRDPRARGHVGGAA